MATSHTPTSVGSAPTGSFYTSTPPKAFMALNDVVFTILFVGVPLGLLMLGLGWTGTAITVIAFSVLSFLAAAIAGGIEESRRRRRHGL
jgi:hypothetical protein